ncbi:death domain-containing protein 1 [Alosa alosa]|uniref:death domain-containing protein 1 n=1 Tax=Alosa alosa TaxID=278164 RepID=UPI0020152470|nr:death domain-containing protein 1 [Alosa alosa]
METKLHTRELQVEPTPEHCKDPQTASHTEDHLLQLLEDISQSIQHHLDGETTKGGQKGQLPQGKELLLGQVITAESLLTLLELLRGLGDVHTERIRAWRHAASTTAQLCSQWQQAGNGRQYTPLTDVPVDDKPPRHLITETINSVLGDIQCIESRLSEMAQKLSRAISTLSEEKYTCTDMDKQEERRRASVDTHSATHDQGTHAHTEQHKVDTFRDSTTISMDLCQSDPDNTETSHSAQNVTADLQDEESLHSTAHSEDDMSPLGAGCHSSHSTDVQQDSGSTGRRPPGTGEDHVGCVSPTNRDSAAGGQRRQMCGSSGRTPLSEGQEDEEGLREGKAGQRDAQLEEENQGVRHGWVTKGLTGKPESHASDMPTLCYITAPLGVAKVMTCDLVNGLSSLMVSDLEELVSSVLRLKLPNNTKCSFPITVAIPFRSCYRSNYRDIIVKFVDQASRVSYVNPVSVEGNYEGQKGSYAEVRVYTLGVFAVVSCLRKESYTIPKKGLSLKLSIDPRICLDYLPGSFTSPVIAQAVIQPVEPSLLSALKSNKDVYRAVLSTSPLLYLSHPSSQPPRRPLVLTLPCPSNPERRRPGEDGESGPPRPTSAVYIQDSPLQQRIRAMSDSVKTSREFAKEQLILLGWKEEQWNVLDDVSIRNLQNGLVSFELMEHFERLIVLRLQFPTRSSNLSAMVEEIEDCVRRVMVTIVLRRQRQDPHSVVVAALPSRDLGWELAKLQGQAYCGPPDPSGEIAMSEGDQLLLSFSGNITADRGSTSPKTITFHHQRKSFEYLKLTVVDPFGNYSSPHYKGLAVFHRIPRTQLVWMDNTAVLSPEHPLVEPVCKLSLTLPKKLRITSRLASAKVMPHTHYDSLSDELLAWLCEELCEEEAALLLLALRVKRSAVQLARLRAPADSLPQQAFHVLGLWRRSLPSHTPKAPLLARCLVRAGRPDLAKELLLREGGGAEG